jgi:hypothetical protein
MADRTLDARIGPCQQKQVFVVIRFRRKNKTPTEKHVSVGVCGDSKIGSGQLSKLGFDGDKVW